MKLFFTSPLYISLFLYQILSTQVTICLGFGFMIPVGIGVGSTIGGTIYGLWCKMNECCNKDGIPADFNGLEQALDLHLYGQHLAREVVVSALKSHWNGQVDPQKALTLSFHGWPGSGKNYVTKFIKESMYAEGGNSKFVHHFDGRLDFPLESKVLEYQDNLKEWIKTNVSKCNQQMFIFDEVDKMPPKILDVIKPIIDYRNNVAGVDYRKAIFIFLSNTGAELINDHYLELWKGSGRKREDLTLGDFDALIYAGAFNEEGGFYRSDTIKGNLIDHYIPFLPMERRHVKLCILDQFHLRNVTNPNEEYIQEVMEFVQWGPSNEKVFSKTGCKRISQIVGATINKYKLNG